MSYKLFLDDLRQPADAYKYTDFEPFLQKGWVVVKNYNEFCQVIKERGLPSFVSFDHDLHPEHYTPEEYWSDYAKSKAYQESQIYIEETGEGCAYFLISYCKKNNHTLPDFYCHSQNPVGKDWIEKALNKFKKQ